MNEGPNTERTTTREIALRFPHKLTPRSSDTFKKSQEILDETIKNRLSNLCFTMKPVYNNRIIGGRVRVTIDGMTKTVNNLEIGRQLKNFEEAFLATIIHEELEARIAVRANRRWYGKYAGFLEKEARRHAYIDSVIMRYFRMRGWKKP